MGGIAPPCKPQRRCFNVLSVTKAAAPCAGTPFLTKADTETFNQFAIEKNENKSQSVLTKINKNRSKKYNCKTTQIKRLTKGCSRLMYACQQGITDTIVYELKTKPNQIHQRDSSYKSVLHYCTGQSDLVAAASVAIAAPDLLESADEDGFTPLHLAVIQGNLAMVNLLLANKADVNAVDNEGHSVVHWATVCGEVEALRSVLQAGANVKISDINGGSPLHYAAQMCGANYDSKLGQATSSKLAFEILDILLKHPQSSVDITDKDGRKPLLWASSAGSAKAVIALVKAGSRVESADKDGLTALHCAASRGHTECIDTLISLCGAPTDLIDSNGCTALHYAVTLGHADATSRLLDLEADPNRQDRKGRTPAHCGCSKGQLETVKLLREWGANLWLRNAKGDLPLHEAASSGRRELVEWFLEQKPKHVNTTSNDGRSLLHIAASNDNTDICKLLLDYGADVNSILRNSRGISITPLDCALQKGLRSTAKFLQSHGGLPASKLRLSAKGASVFNDTEQVRPLKYSERDVLPNIKDSKKIKMYSNRSESESGGHCSCNEHTYKKECRYSHTCKFHKNKFRRRTSSCGEPKNVCREDSCSDICRSKSNIEIRRMKSRELEFSSESELDSCENCCHHRKKHKLLKRRERTTRKKRSNKGCKNDNCGKNLISNEETENDKLFHSEAKFRSDFPKKSSSRPSSKTLNETNPQSATSYTIKDNVHCDAPIQQTTTNLTDENVRHRDCDQQVVVVQAEIHAESQTASINLPLNSSEHYNKLHDHDFTKEEVDTGVAISNEAKVDLNDTIITGKTNIENDQSHQQRKSTDDVTTKSDGQENEIPEKITEDTSTIQPSSSEIKQNNHEPKEDEKNSVGQYNLQSDLRPNATESNEIPVSQPISKPLEIQEIPQQNKNLEESVDLQDPIIDKQEKSHFEVEQNETRKNEASSNVDISEPKTENISANNVIGTIPPNEQQVQSNTQNQSSQPTDSTKPKQSIQSPLSSPTNEVTQNIRDQEPRRSFTLLSESPGDEEVQTRKSSFQVLKSDESLDVNDDIKTFQIVSNGPPNSNLSAFNQSSDGEAAVDDDEDYEGEENGFTSKNRLFATHALSPSVIHNGYNEHNNGRKRRLKKRIKSGGTRGRSSLKVASKVPKRNSQNQQPKDQDSGFEPSPRANTKIPQPRSTYATHVPRKAIYTTLDGRICSSRTENRKPGDKTACDMSAVTRSIQRNIRRYYMERKIFQHLLELKSLQIRSNKLNEAVLVKRAVDEYHKSCVALGGETGTTLRRYTFSEYTFKNFELFLYETLKSLQRPGTFNFQNINEVYEEAERRLSPDYNAYEKALQCTTKTHRCLHAAHAYTGIPCAAYIPMMNHHTMPKFGFGPYKKSGAGSFYLPKILSSNLGCGSKVSLELSHGKSKQLIALPSDKLDSNKRYYVTFTVKDPNGKQQIYESKQQKGPTNPIAESPGVASCYAKSCDQKKNIQDKDEK